MSEPLSKEARTKVVSAVHDINQAFVEGPMTAAALKEAAVKAARENGFGPDMIRLMCAGYNTGATAAQREAGSSILQKHAGFPIADADEVIRELYPKVDEQKYAAQQQDGTVVSPEYQSLPRNKVAHYQSFADKQAEYVTIPLTTPVPVEEDFDRLLGQSQRLQREIKTAHYASMEAEENLIDAVRELAQYFKQASDRRDWSYGEVKFAAVRRFGKVGSTVMQCVREVNGYTVDTEAKPTRPIDWNSRPFALLNDCVSKAGEVNRRREEHVKVAVANRKKIAEIMGPWREQPQPKPEPAPQDGVLVRSKRAFKPSSTAVSTAVIAGSLKNLLGDYIKPKSTEQLVQGKLDALSDPEHEEKLRRIRAQSMLQSFLTDDPIISGHNPDEIMRIFNELNQMSPRAAQQPAVARSVLRRWATQGAIEPFEAKEITDLEKNLTTTQGRVPQPPGTGEKVSNVLRRRSVVS